MPDSLVAERPVLLLSSCPYSTRFDSLWQVPCGPGQFQGRYEEALDAVDQAIRLKPDYDHAHKQKGITLYSAKRYKEALASFDKCIRLKPDHADHADAYNYKGNALYELKEYEKALEAFEKEFEYAIKLAPRYKAAYTGKAEAHECLARLYHQKAADL